MRQSLRSLSPTESCSEVLLDLDGVNAEQHRHQANELKELQIVFSHKYFLPQLEQVEQLQHLLRLHGPPVVQDNLKPVEQLLLFSDRYPVALLDVLKQLTVGLPLHHVDVLAPDLLSLQLALNVARARLIEKVIVPDRLELLLHKDVLVKFDFVHLALQGFLFAHLRVLDFAES
jgi:hypothetical protein